MAANVTYIPPKAAKPEPLRVAAYCRVSSDSSDQRIDGERLRRSGPTGIHLHLPKPAYELSQKNGEGRIYNLLCPIWI